MPNWSFNNLTISGDPEDMNSFFDLSLRKNETGDLIFKASHIFPMPDKIKNTISPSSSALGVRWINENKSTKRNDKINDILETDDVDSDLIPCENNSPEKCKVLKEKFGAENWYDWNIMTYGTKWDFESENVNKSDISFNCYFETAWSPPSIFLFNLQNKFPKLDIRLTYELEGSDECGVFYTDRSEKNPTISHESSEVRYLSEDGMDIYFDESAREWKYNHNDEVCDYINQINPFDEN
jgi:hypothetical protein